MTMAMQGFTLVAISAVEKQAYILDLTKSFQNYWSMKCRSKALGNGV